MPRHNTVLFPILFLAGFTVAVRASEGPLAPSELRCEYLENPRLLDVAQPRFSWVLHHTERAQRQSAYQIVVSTDPSCVTGDEWDSGKVESNQSTQVVYQGRALKSNRSYYWKVRYWDGKDRQSPFSGLARFDTGLLESGDRKAHWIGGNRQLRRVFQLEGEISRARVFVSALGYYELHLNGRKVGPNVMDPGWTEWDKRVLYNAYDVTDLLKPGANVIGAFLGQGWYGTFPGKSFLIECEDCRALWVQLEVEMKNGEVRRVLSDGSWKINGGPIISDHLYNGEVYDARLETPGWLEPEFDDSTWPAAKRKPAPGGTFSAQMMQPIQVVDTIVPLVMTNPLPGVYIFDMGQNFTGWAQLRVQGPRGTRVQLRHSELLYENGLLNRENLRTAKARDIYILKGEEKEVYEPRFTYHGFRYVELTGFPGVPDADTIRGRVVHTAVPQTGSFSSSTQLLNQLQRIITWGQKTNLHSIPTDCPQRNERMGWLGDLAVTIESSMLNFDMAAFYSAYVEAIRDAQREDGSIPDTVPERFSSQRGDPAWGAAYPLLCWNMYRYYGDRRILEENYEALKRYVAYLQTRSKLGLLAFSQYGDWVSIESTPGSLVSSFFYYYDVDILARAAKVLGKEGDATAFRTLADEIKLRFNEAFLDRETRNYANGSQTANALPLFLSLAPDSVRHQVFKNLQNNIAYTHDTHVTTGFIGVKFLMEVLTNYGRTWLAYELATQSTYPSWGYMLENGATTLWEIWQQKTGPLMNSHNHPMLGSVGAWFYKALAGINLDPDEVGYRKVLIAPHAVRDLRHAAGSIATLRGRISTAWKVNPLDDVMTLEVNIPVSSEAEILYPRNREKVLIYETGRKVWEKGHFHDGVPGILGAEPISSPLFLYQDPVSVTVGSGSYSFEFRRE